MAFPSLTGAGTSFSSPPIAAATQYLCEIHRVDSGTDEMFLDGVSLGICVTSDPLTFGAFFIGSYYGTFSGTPTFSNYQIWDLAVGTSRHGSDIFSDPLSSIPTVGPWRTVHGSADMSIVSGRLNIYDQGNRPYARWEAGGVSPPGYTDVWLEYKVSFGSDYIAWLNSTSPGADSDYICEMFSWASGGGGGSLEPQLQWQTDLIASSGLHVVGRF